MSKMDKKIDAHTLAAAEMFNKKPADVTLEERHAAKNITFMIMYGATPVQIFKKLISDIGPLPHSIMAIPMVCSCKSGMQGHIFGDDRCEAISLTKETE